MNRMVWRVCVQIAVLSVVATALNVLTGAPLGQQALGLAGALVATVGAAWYTVGGRFPGARALGLKGGLAGLVAAACAMTLITGFWAAVKERLTPVAWDLPSGVSLALYVLIFLLACSLAFWCITEVVLRDRARAAAAAAGKAAAETGPHAVGQAGVPVPDGVGERPARG